MNWITEKPEGIILTVFIQPRSSKNMIAGLHGDALKIKLTAPPVNNAANKMCIQYLSKQLKVAKSSLNIVAGHTSRLKQILVRNVDYRLKEKIESLSA
jgi:uncharacterized protein